MKSLSGTPCAPSRGVALAATLLGSVSLASGQQTSVGADEAILINESLGVSASDIVFLDLDSRPGRPLTADIPIDGVTHTIDLEPFSIRSEAYEVVVQGQDGVLRDHPPGPERTLRGTVAGDPDSVIAGSMLRNGLHALIRLGDGRRFWVQPIVPTDMAGGLTGYAVYDSDDVLPHGGTCGVPELGIDRRHETPEAEGGVVAGGGPCVAELACDADTEYFNTYGSVANTESRINLVINTVNLQYETQVGITHQITTIIVRTGTDPYTSNNAGTRLCEFITEWTNNQTAVPWDVAYIFPGDNLSGGTIGIAADIGGSGICTSQGSCSGGPFGPLGSYCLAQSDFNGNFGCATDLTAHELGHLWGAFHCSCTSFTMNPFVTCANDFSAESISSISAYRESRTCLDGNCIDVANDDCSGIIAITAGTVPFSTASTTTDGPSEALCGFSGSTQVHNDIWYRFTAPMSGTALVRLCDSQFDTRVAVYQGLCPTSPNTAIACDDDSCGNDAEIEFPVVAGGFYVARIGGASANEEGAGHLELMFLEAPCPADVDGDGTVGVGDLAVVILQWGTDQEDADITDDGTVDVSDLTEVIVSWGDCD